MTFGIDYDNTFTRDPPFWSNFVSLAKTHGHDCVLVTSRSGEGEQGKQVRRAIGDLMPIVFAESPMITVR